MALNKNKLSAITYLLINTAYGGDAEKFAKSIGYPLEEVEEVVYKIMDFVDRWENKYGTE